MPELTEQEKLKHSRIEVAANEETATLLEEALERLKTKLDIRIRATFANEYLAIADAEARLKEFRAKTEVPARQRLEKLRTARKKKRA